MIYERNFSNNTSIYNNNFKFIGRALRSILDQSIERNKFEIIVINDCSNDNSKTIISKFSENIKG